MSAKMLIQKKEFSKKKKKKKAKKETAPKTKRQKRKPGEPRKPRTGTITEAVLELLSKDPHASTQDIRAQLVKRFPKTKFGKSHLAWYKYQVRIGNLELPHGKELPPAKKGRPKEAKEAVKEGKKKKSKRKSD